LRVIKLNKSYLLKVSFDKNLSFSFKFNLKEKLKKKNFFKLIIFFDLVLRLKKPPFGNIEIKNQLLIGFFILDFLIDIFPEVIVSRIKIFFFPEKHFITELSLTELFEMS